MANLLSWNLISRRIFLNPGVGKFDFILLNKLVYFWELKVSNLAHVSLCYSHQNLCCWVVHHTSTHWHVSNFYLIWWFLFVSAVLGICRGGCWWWDDGIWLVSSTSPTRACSAVEKSWSVMSKGGDIIDHRNNIL